MNDLEKLSTKELKEKYKTIFDEDAPNGYTKTFLIKEILFKIQNQSLSQDSKSMINKLVRNYKSTKVVKLSTIKRFKTTIGTKFIKEYKGEKYEVIALEKGFRFKNNEYKSLSAIANKITGKHWNGKKFFGVANG